jgi:hypothetical protein
MTAAETGDARPAGGAVGIAELAGTIAHTLVFALGYAYVIGTASLLGFDALPGAIYPAAAVLAAITSLWHREPLDAGRRAARFVGVVAGVLLALGAPVLVARWFDGSFDGLGYHQHAILQLAHDWNPLRDEAPRAPGEMWLIHYPKASWIVGAVLMKCFGSVEAAKSVNVLAALAAASLAISLLAGRPWGTRGAVIAWLAGIGVAANPVVAAQLFSSYTDGLLASLLLLSVLASIRAALEPGPGSILLLGMSIVLCANTKFTALVYLGIGLLVLIGVWLVLRRPAPLRGVIACWLIALAVGVCVLGADPYLRNAFRHGHPFYPLLGENPADIMRPSRPKSFLEMNRLERLVYSVFAAPSNATGARPVLRAPLIVTREDIFQLAHYDLRIGGFGPLFGASLILSVALLFFMTGHAMPPSAVLWGILVFVVASTVINPEGWWARYVPQLWWLPWIAILGVVLAGGTRAPRVLASIAALVLIADAALVGGAAVGHAYFYTERQRAQIAALAAGQVREEGPYSIYFGPFEGIAHRYSAAGIRFVRVESAAELACANPENLGGPVPIMRLCRSPAEERSGQQGTGPLLREAGPR